MSAARPELGTRPLCPAQSWASSGLLALTGWPGQPPVVPKAPTVDRLASVVKELEALGAPTGGSDLLVGLGGRAALSGAARAGTTSANGACRLVEGDDGWVAVSLARADDLAAVAAITGFDGVPPWAAVSRAAERCAAELLERAALLGVPAARVGAVTAMAGSTPWTSSVLGTPGPPSSAGRHRGLIVDLSSLWAGPLCTRMLQRAGYDVVKVESTRRPDGARRGPSAWWEWLHAGQRFVQVDFQSMPGREQLRRLLESADVVIEASRPRALQQLGLDLDALDLRDGCVWLSITGYGRHDPPPGRVAFGDDAAVAGGLVAAVADRPIFIGDALADPVTGLYAALAVLRSRALGGGVLIDLPMAAAAAVVAAVDPGAGEDDVLVVPLDPDADTWVLHCAHGSAVVADPTAPPQCGEGVAC